jgi:UDP-glucose 4-epimerase
MNILITGGAGFIGSHLCDALIKRGYTVHCVDNFHLGRKENIEHLQGHNRFYFHRFDLLDHKTMNALFSENKFDIVFHMAANSDIQQANKDHHLDLNLTFMTTFEILEHMLHHNVKKIFFASTSAVFGETKKLIHENFGPMLPVSFYGASKLAAESYLSVFVNNYDFKAWVLRFPNVVGERATHGVIYDFINKLKKDPSKLIVLGDGSQTKPYIYIKDMIDAILLVFDKADEPLSVYHIGNEDLTSVKDIAAIVMDEMGLNKDTIVYTGGERGWVGDVPFYNYDISKIKALGFTQRYNSTEAVRKAVRRMLDKDSGDAD